MLKVVVGAATLAIATVGGMVGSAQAADGCGPGWHRNVYGYCRPNAYRPYVYGAPVVVGPVWRGRSTMPGVRAPAGIGAGAGRASAAAGTTTGAAEPAGPVLRPAAMEEAGSAGLPPVHRGPSGPKAACTGPGCDFAL